MIDKQQLKQILLNNQQDVIAHCIVPRQLPNDDWERRVFVGLRRAGKSFMLYQKIQQLLSQGRTWKEMLYLSFEDNRMEGFSAEDFETILQCHAEMYGDTRPMLFLDEIQNIDGWEKFARRLADAKYYVWITGSNAKMLSREIQGALGARYLTHEVFPYSFAEYLRVHEVSTDALSVLARNSNAAIIRNWNEYLIWGGLPEAATMEVKRDYISSTFQKIYLGDVCTRNKVANPAILKLMLKKMAESVGQPVSYNRMAAILSSVIGKISMPTIAKYVEYCQDAWMLLRLRNVSAPFAEKETVSKYYFSDNGVLNLFLLNGETQLLENLVAITLFKHYGHDETNERVFFYNNRIEVDFYIPDDELAIQASYSVLQKKETYNREVGALQKLPRVLPCKRRLILTNDESSIIQDEYGQIEVMPLWQYLLHET